MISLQSVGAKMGGRFHVALFGVVTPKQGILC